jgi:hypothetical protein
VRSPETRYFFCVSLVLARASLIVACLCMGFGAIAEKSLGPLDNAKQNDSSHLPLVGPESGWERVSPKEFIPVWMETLPWWNRKEKVLKQMREERAVVVSVVTKGNSSSPVSKGGQQVRKQLKISGAGFIEAPPEFSSNRIREFYRLKELSQYVKESTFNQHQKHLFLHVAAFDYHARMLMEIFFHDQLKGRRQILFHVVAGTLSGMKGVVEIKEIEHLKSEFSMTALYDYDKLPIPQLFVEFGLEMVLKQMAEKIRSMVEALYRSQGSKSESEAVSE